MKSNYGIYGANEFAFGMMWGTHGVRNLSVLKQADVRVAVDKAYIDMTPRTIDNLGLAFLDKIKKRSQDYDKKTDLLDLKQKGIKTVKDWLASELVEVFKNGVFNNNRHRNLCDGFITKFQAAIGEINAFVGEHFPQGTKIDPNLITYGKAQKIVNMSFKYLYLFDDTFDESGNCKYPQIFDNCHMAIDANILDWFKKNDKNSASNYSVTWSNMDYNEYKDAQKSIKSYCGQNSQSIQNSYWSAFPWTKSKPSFGDTTLPFYAEFYIFDMAINK